MLLKEPIPTRISVTVNKQSKEQKPKVINSHELKVKSGIFAGTIDI
jgi:hypothetical protein